MYAAVKTHKSSGYLVYLDQNLGKTIQMTNSQSPDIHCPVAVLDLPAPDDVDGDGSLVGDLGDVVEPLDVAEEGEELLFDDRIEREQISFSL